MVIRKEEPKDYKGIYEVVKSAFLSAEHSDGTEQDLVNELRKGDAYIPKLSLVATENEKILGHIMFTKAKVRDEIVLALAPLSVRPKYQKKGIGAALINMGHKIAKDLGYRYSVVLGSEKYYQRFGYVPARTFGIKSPFDVPNENFMALKLNPEVPATKGIMKYAKEFGVRKFN